MRQPLAGAQAKRHITKMHVRFAALILIVIAAAAATIALASASGTLGAVALAAILGSAALHLSKGR